jgi:hypothetical protein
MPLFPAGPLQHTVLRWVAPLPQEDYNVINAP